MRGNYVNTSIHIRPFNCERINTLPLLELIIPLKCIEIWNDGTTNNPRDNESDPLISLELSTFFVRIFEWQIKYERIKKNKENISGIKYIWEIHICWSIIVLFSSTDSLLILNRVSRCYLWFCFIIIFSTCIDNMWWLFIQISILWTFWLNFFPAI